MRKNVGSRRNCDLGFDIGHLSFSLPRQDSQSNLDRYRLTRSGSCRISELVSSSAALGKPLSEHQNHSPDTALVSGLESLALDLEFPSRLRPRNTKFKLLKFKFLILA